MNLKPGSRWKSAVCATEVVVVRPPSGDVSLECGRAPMLAAAAELGRLPGDKVVHIGLTSPAVPLALFASGLLGRPFAPLNYRLPDEDLRRLLARTAPATAVVDDDMTTRVAGVPGVEVIPR